MKHAQSNPAHHDPLQLRDVSFGYEPGSPVVHSLSVTLGTGKLCALIGPNAAGKTTLLRLMLGQEQPWTGQVRLAGAVVDKLTPGRRAALVSYVPQRGGTSFLFTVGEVVRMGRYALERDESAVERAMADADVTDLAQRVFGELSAGQQQSVLLARALAQSAPQGRVILLDEPTSAMDLWHVHRVMSLLRDLAHKRGLAVVVVLHDLNLAARYADVVWLMHRGGLVAAGPWDQVLLPTVLEPVYRVGLKPVGLADGGRPMFFVEPAATLSVEPAR